MLGAGGEGGYSGVGMERGPLPATPPQSPDRTWKRGEGGGCGVSPPARNGRQLGSCSTD